MQRFQVLEIKTTFPINPCSTSGFAPFHLKSLLTADLRSDHVSERHTDLQKSLTRSQRSCFAPQSPSSTCEGGGHVWLTWACFQVFSCTVRQLYLLRIATLAATSITQQSLPLNCRRSCCIVGNVGTRKVMLNWWRTLRVTYQNQDSGAHQHHPQVKSCDSNLPVSFLVPRICRKCFLSVCLIKILFTH